VAQALDQHARQLRQVLDFAPDEVVRQHGDDLVVGLAVVEHRQAADHLGLDQDLARVDRTFAEHADVERIAVALLGAGRQVADAAATQRARDEAVEARRLAAGALRAVDAQEAVHLVDLVLHEVERGDLDVRLHDLRRLRPRRDAVPGMRTPAVERFGEGHDGRAP